MSPIAWVVPKLRGSLTGYPGQVSIKKKSRGWDSNPQLAAYEAATLPLSYPGKI